MARGEAFLKRGDLFILCYSTDFIADCFSTFYNIQHDVACAEDDIYFQFEDGSSPPILLMKWGP